MCRLPAGLNKNVKAMARCIDNCAASGGTKIIASSSVNVVVTGIAGSLYPPPRGGCQGLGGNGFTSAGHHADRAAPKWGPNWSHLKFKGRGQRDTCVTDAKGIVEVIMLLPGQQAARVRRQAAELLCRYVGGDLALVDEVCRNRGFQEQLAVQAPEDPRRLFGEVVEATAGGSQRARRRVRVF